MSTEKLPMTRLSCKRCGYGWMPRSDTPPDVCPSCKSRKWDVAKAADRATDDLSPTHRRMVEAFLRVLRNGEPHQIRSLSLQIEGIDSMLRGADGQKTAKKK